MLTWSLKLSPTRFTVFDTEKHSFVSSEETERNPVVVKSSTELNGEDIFPRDKFKGQLYKHRIILYINYKQGLRIVSRGFWGLKGLTIFTENNEYYCIKTSMDSNTIILLNPPQYLKCAFSI